MDPPVVVLGAGAVGSLFGARLAARGVAILLVGRPDHVAAIRRDGLSVEGLAPARVELPAAIAVPRGSTARAVLVTVKAFDLEEACGELARAIAPTPTALLGNGLGIEATAVGALRAGGWPRPEASVVRAVHTVPATLLGPGRVRASGTGEVVLPEPSGPAAGAVRLLAEVLGGGPWSLRRTPHLDLELWRKAAVNAAINPVTALRRVPNGALNAGAPREEALGLLDEAVHVAEACGAALDLSTARADLDRVVRATAENRSSMLQDLERGRPTEIDAISGEILRRGEARGLTLPATRRAVASVREAVARRASAAQR
jgi:2-dehydropantoate 2-reductase